MRELEGRVAFVTGGAGGIGSAISRRLAASGCSVTVGASGNLERADSLVAELPGAGHRAARVPADDSSALAELVTRIEAAHGRLDVLVNCAGITKPVEHHDLDALDDELIDRIFRVNWRGAFAAIRACRRLLATGDGGVVVNISSIAGVTGVGSNVAYCASKAALDSMTKSLARALAPEIRVVSVSPGVVLGEYATHLSSDWIEAQVRATPLRRLAEPADVADAVMAVLTLRSTTGAIIPVDGGRPLGV